MPTLPKVKKWDSDSRQWMCVHGAAVGHTDQVRPPLQGSLGFLYDSTKVNLVQCVHLKTEDKGSACSTQLPGCPLVGTFKVQICHVFDIEYMFNMAMLMLT